MKHPTAKVSEQVNRKCLSRNTMIQLSTPYSYTDREPSVSHPLKFHVNNASYLLTYCSTDLGMLLLNIH